MDKLEFEMLEQSFTAEVTYILGSVFIGFIIDKYVAKFPILCKHCNSSKFIEKIICNDLYSFFKFKSCNSIWYGLKWYTVCIE